MSLEPIKFLSRVIAPISRKNSCQTFPEDRPSFWTSKKVWQSFALCFNWRCLRDWPPRTLSIISVFITLPPRSGYMLLPRQHLDCPVFCWIIMGLRVVSHKNPGSENREENETNALCPIKEDTGGFGTINAWRSQLLLLRVPRGHHWLASVIISNFFQGGY